MRVNSNENIKNENYQLQLNWFNSCIKPKIVTDYSYQPVQERPRPSHNATTNQAAAGHTRSMNNISNRSTTASNIQNTNSNGGMSIQINSYNRNSNFNGTSSGGNSNSISSVSTSNASSSYACDNSRSSHSSNATNGNYSSIQRPVTANGSYIKRKEDDADEIVDLTSSQPKRMKISSNSPPAENYELPKEAFFADNMMDADFIDDDLNVFDDDFNEAEYQSAFPGDSNNHYSAANLDAENDFFPIHEEEIIGLDNLAPSASLQPSPPASEPQQQSSKAELEMILNTLQQRQNVVNNSIVEALTSGKSVDQKALLEERADLVEQIQDLQDRISNWDSNVPVNTDDADVHVILSDDENEPAETSPFFASTSTETPINSVATHPPTPSVAPETLPVAPPVVSSQPTYPWSRDVRKALVQNFKLSEFRPNQLEAINTTLKGEDVFVLMPTGGGKSLCYQLPAIIQRHGRQGVTFVISPLLSLMEDQVRQLVENRGIPAHMLSGTTEAAKKKWLYADLNKPTPTTVLVYITPELLKNSSALQRLLESMARRDRLARFVIDEAHCVSQWGHDFRPDYKSLGSLKSSYPNVPIMALTATANDAVQKDVLHNLQMTHCKVLKQSFNRTNLIYQIVPKTNSTVYTDMSNFIRSQPPGQSGIIYCTTRNDCELVASKLQTEHGISIKHYHGGMSTSERSIVQHEWQKSEINVISATIAFGMGIDKANVRFVIHYTVPSSLEGYYQETGRAGRDGLPATCRLYYHFGDTQKNHFLIDKSEGNFQQKQRLRDNLNTMVRYCENEIDCRRKQIMGYFGERFDPAGCRRMCDNCVKGLNSTRVLKDKSEEAKTLLKIVGAINSPETITLAQTIDVYRGSRGKKLLEQGRDRLEGYGLGSKQTRQEVDRLLKHMVIEGILQQKSVATSMGSFTQVVLGPKANAILNGTQKLMISFNSDTAPARGTGSGFVSAGTMVNRATTQPAAPGRRSLPVSKSKPQAVRRATITAAGSNRTVSTASPSTANISRNSSPVPIVRTANDKALENCLKELQTMRQQIQAKKNIRHPGAILTDTALKSIAKKLPITDREFLMVTNMKEELYALYGKSFLTISKKYDQMKSTT